MIEVITVHVKQVCFASCVCLWIKHPKKNVKYTKMLNTQRQVTRILSAWLYFQWSLTVFAKHKWPEFGGFHCVKDKNTLLECHLGLEFSFCSVTDSQCGWWQVTSATSVLSSFFSQMVVSFPASQCCSEDQYIWVLRWSDIKGLRPIKWNTSMKILSKSSLQRKRE